MDRIEASYFFTSPFALMGMTTTISQRLDETLIQVANGIRTLLN
jgi:hypothetical protein